MKILTEQFKEKEFFYKGLLKRDSQYSESFYFDLKNKKIYFGSFQGYGVDNVNMEEEAGDDKLENFYVNAESFLHICKKYDFIKYDGEFFSNGKEKFKLQKFIEDEESKKFNFEEETLIDIKLNDYFKSIIDKASKFPEPEINESISGFNFRNNKLRTVSPKRLFSVDIEYNLDCIIPENVFAYLLNLILKEEMKLYTCKTNDFKYIKLVYNDLKVIFPEKVSLTYNEKQINDLLILSKTDNFITFNKKEFEKIKGDLSYFSKIGEEDILWIKIIPNNTEMHVTLQSNTKGVSCKKVLPLISIENITEDYDFMINLKTMYFAIECFPKEINLHIDPYEKSKVFFEDPKLKENIQVLCALISSS